MTTVLNNNNCDNKIEQLEKCKRLLSSRLAPLASFEDLPTDEQNSSSSDDDKQPQQCSTNQTFQSSQITVLITDHDDNKIHSWNDSPLPQCSSPSIISNNEDRLLNSQPKGLSN